VTDRILHLIPTFEGGGAERQVGYLAAGLVGLGWDVHVGHVGGGPNLERVRASGARVHRVAAASSYDPRLVPRMLRLIREVRPLAVQTWLPMMDIVGGAAALLARVPWIVSERCDSVFEPSHTKIRLRRQIARGAAAVVSNSSAGNAYWLRRIGPDRCAVIPNALPIEEIDAAPAAQRARLSIPPDVPLLRFVGRLDPQKNIAALLDALEVVVAKSDAHALLLGRGSLESEVERRLEGAPLAGRVVAPGFVADPWSWMKSAALFVSVSLWEGMPNTVMEAMAARCPVVVSEIPNHREILDDASARFVPTGDVPAIAEAILAGLGEDGRAERVAAARAHAETWSIEAVARRWAAFYESLAERRGAGR